MFGLGALTSIISNKFSYRLLKVSAILVVLLGGIMINRGFALSGKGITPISFNENKSISRLNGNFQEVTSTIDENGYNPITVQKGVKVIWTIKVKSSDLNGCNNPLTIPDFDITKQLSPGDNVIEFTPEKTGKIVYTCWMGMISSTITVVDDLNNVDLKEIEKSKKEQLNKSPKRGCCG